MSVQATLAFVSLITSLGSVIVVVWSVRILVGQMRAQSHQSIYTHQQNLDLLLFANLELRTKLYSTDFRPDPSDNDSYGLRAAAEMQLMVLEHVWGLVPNMAPDVASGWRHYSHEIARLPAISHHLKTIPAA